MQAKATQCQILYSLNAGAICVQWAAKRKKKNTWGYIYKNKHSNMMYNEAITIAKDDKANVKCVRCTL